MKTSQIWQHLISFQIKYLHSESRAEFGTVNEFVWNRPNMKHNYSKHSAIFFNWKNKLTSLPRFSEKMNEIILWKIVKDENIITLRSQKSVESKQPWRLEKILKYNDHVGPNNCVGRIWKKKYMKAMPYCN